MAEIYKIIKNKEKYGFKYMIEKEEFEIISFDIDYVINEFNKKTSEKHLLITDVICELDEMSKKNLSNMDEDTKSYVEKSFFFISCSHIMNIAKKKIDLFYGKILDIFLYSISEHAIDFCHTISYIYMFQIQIYSIASLLYWGKKISWKQMYFIENNLKKIVDEIVYFAIKYKGNLKKYITENPDTLNWVDQIKAVKKA